MVYKIGFVDEFPLASSTKSDLRKHLKTFLYYTTFIEILHILIYNVNSIIKMQAWFS